MTVLHKHVAQEQDKYDLMEGMHAMLCICVSSASTSVILSRNLHRISVHQVGGPDGPSEDQR